MLNDRLGVVTDVGRGWRCRQIHEEVRAVVVVLRGARPGYVLNSSTHPSIRWRSLWRGGGDAGGGVDVEAGDRKVGVIVFAELG